MYKKYLHGIDQRTEDIVSEKICNLSHLGTPVTHGNVLKRTTRVSLTIRHVPKTLKVKLKLGKWCSMWKRSWILWICSYSSHALLFCIPSDLRFRTKSAAWDCTRLRWWSSIRVRNRAALSRRLPPPPCRNRRCAPTVGVRRSSTTLGGGMLCAPTAAQCWKKTSLSRRSVSRRRVAVPPPSSDSLSLPRVSHCLAFRPADLMCLVRKGWI